MCVYHFVHFAICSKLFWSNHKNYYLKYKYDWRLIWISRLNLISLWVNSFKSKCDWFGRALEKECVVYLIRCLWANLVDFELFIGDWSHGIHQAVNKNPKKRQKIMPCDDYNLQNNVFINFVWVIKCLITHRWKNSITSKLDKCQCHNTHRQVEPPVLSKELRFLKTSNTSVSHWFFYKIWHAYTLFEHSRNRRNIINRINP